MLLILPFLVVPAALLAFVQPNGRRILGALGLLAAVGLAFAPLGGPDSPLLVWGIVPLGVTLGAIVVELGGFVLAALSRRRHGAAS